MNEKLITLVIAIIGTATALVGYSYQKELERTAEVIKTRQEIYSRMIVNTTKRVDILNRLSEDPAWNATNNYGKYKLFTNDPDARANRIEMQEIATLLTVYGTDEGINAYADYLKEGLEQAIGKSSKEADLGKLILTLRQSVYPSTNVKSSVINLIIWNDRKHFDLETHDKQ